MSAVLRRERALEDTDQMSPELRECVHEYGYAIVQACLCAKVADPRRIHQLVREIWDGARQPNQRRERAGTLDWILLQAGAGISAATLLRVLRNASLVIIPAEATRQMVEASMREVADFNLRVTKLEKHRRRLQAAINAGASYLRPHLAADATGKSGALSRRFGVEEICPVTSVPPPD